MLISAKAGSVWNKIYENHMNNESFIWTSKAVPLMLNSKEEITVFSSAEALEYNSPGMIFEIFEKNNTTCTVDNKNIHPADFLTCVLREYLRNHLSSKKVFYIYLHPCLNSFQINYDFFKSDHKSC